MLFMSTAGSTATMTWNLQQYLELGHQGGEQPHWYHFEVSEYTHTVLCNWRHLAYP